MTIRQAAMVLAAASAALVAGAYGFQYIGGLAPCILCWWQRYAHGAVIALAVIAILARGGVATALLALAAIAMLTGAGIAGFHVGVEQHWWQGTAECGSTLGTSMSLEELRRALLAQPVVRCDEVAWSMFGISMAGYNMLISLALALFALTAIGRWARR